MAKLCVCSSTAAAQQQLRRAPCCPASACSSVHLSPRPSTWCSLPRTFANPRTHGSSITVDPPSRPLTLDAVVCVCACVRCLGRRYCASVNMFMFSCRRKAREGLRLPDGVRHVQGKHSCSPCTHSLPFPLFPPLTALSPPLPALPLSLTPRLPLPALPRPSLSQQSLKRHG